MKKALFSLGLALSLLSANAQLADGSIAPNWTMTDINGNSHTLYNYLDSGKAIVLDFSATWCSPCWNYHNSNALKDVYNNYGPNGTDEAMVFFIEADNSTTSADLNGTGGNTVGNWVTGTPYPIIDNHTQNSAYAISYYPTIYLICPNRIITEIGQANAANIYSAIKASSCQPASSANDPSITAYTGANAACDALDVTIELQNMGTSPLTSATIEVGDGSTTLLTYNWSGNLATYAIESVTVGSINISSATTLSISISSADDNSANNTITTLVETPKSSATDITVNFFTDNYPGETSWKIVGSSGNVVASGGPYTPGTDDQWGGGGPDALTTMTSTHNIPANDCYKVILDDSFSDGQQYGTGTNPSGGFGIQITDHTGEVFNWDPGANFSQAVREAAIRTEFVSIDEIDAVENLNIYPNPFNNIANVQFELTEAKNVQLDIYNMLGKKVSAVNYGKLSAGIQNFEFNGSNLEAGVYFFNIVVDGETTTKKVTLTK